ncbi:MAG TPA: hypothetical protein VNJ04_16845 [Gemmatimonadaceae bacterium]|nr:hypothetical protein [Gemmatimonadaceae bacterium]
MEHYPSNHIAVAYGDIFEEMVALSRDLGFQVRVIRKKKLQAPSTLSSTLHHI